MGGHETFLGRNAMTNVRRTLATPLTTDFNDDQSVGRRNRIDQTMRYGRQARFDAMSPDAQVNEERHLREIAEHLGDADNDEVTFT